MQNLPYDTASFAKKSIFFSMVFIVANIIYDLTGLWENAQYRIIMSPATPYKEAIELEENVANILFVASIGLILIAIVSVVFNYIWIYRASKNAATIDPSPDRIRPGWAIGWFAIPFANLWKPFEAMKQTWNSSQPTIQPLDAPVPQFIYLW